YLFADTAVPAGEYVVVTLAGVSQGAMVGTNGTFSATFDTGSLTTGSYPITYSYAGGPYFTAADDGSGTLTVIAAAAPNVTLNPRGRSVSAGDNASFTAAATGSPTPAVQWQVSTDGGTTWTNVTGNTSATSTTLTVHTSLSMNGYKYRAVFTNSLGTVVT